MTKNINDRSQIQFASFEDLLNMQRTTSSETTLASEFPNIINGIFFQGVNLAIMFLEIFQLILLDTLINSC